MGMSPVLVTPSWVTATVPPGGTPGGTVQVMAVADTVHCDMSSSSPPTVTLVLAASSALKVPLMMMVLLARTAPDTVGPAGSKEDMDGY